MIQTKETSKQEQTINSNEIARRSYLLWEQAGRPQGRDKEFWFQAETQLKAESQKVVAKVPEASKTQQIPVATARVDIQAKAAPAPKQVAVTNVKPSPVVQAAAPAKKAKSSARR